MALALKTSTLLPFGAEDREALGAHGIELVERSCPTEEELIEHGREVDALLVVGEPVTAKVIEQLDRCRVIARFGVGLDNVDIDAATRRGMQVTYVPGASVEEVSDHALAMIFSLGRRLPDLDAATRRGDWSILDQLPLFRRLADQTVGVIGLGRIGQVLARKVHGLGIDLVAYDPYLSADEVAALGARPLPLDQLLATSDFVSIHTPLTPETRHLLGVAELARMKPTACLINVARGGVVDQEAMVAALREGRLGGAGVDVFELEPLPLDDPLLALDNVILTPHAAHHSLESMNELRARAIADVAAVLAGEQPHFPVNAVAPR
ncbi:MAG: C-terminal binding protein [Actinobacteria bacterium]|nr:C-terminal binding protein [Actinomycetota bacterium]